MSDNSVQSSIAGQNAGLPENGALPLVHVGCLSALRELRPISASTQHRSEMKRTFRDVMGMLDGTTDIDCSNMGLTSLEGCPEIAEGSFNCSNNRLRTLHGAPDEVHFDFDCSSNMISTLDGAPEFVNGYFSCANNLPENLEHGPLDITGDFNCSDNWLTNLKRFPKKVIGSLDCAENPAVSCDTVRQDPGNRCVRLVQGGSTRCCQESTPEQSVALSPPSPPNNTAI